MGPHFIYISSIVEKIVPVNTREMHVDDAPISFIVIMDYIFRLRRDICINFGCNDVVVTGRERFMHLDSMEIEVSSG